MSRVSVLLADDHREFLAVETRLLEPEFEVVKAVCDGEAAFLEAARLEPDLLVLDISMPIMGGIDTARRLRAAGSPTKVVFLTVHGDPDFVRAALATGASGYVTKCRLASDLIPALKEALAGRLFVSPTLCLGSQDGK